LKRRYRWKRKWTRGNKGFAKAVKKVILSTAENCYRSVDLKDVFTFTSAGGANNATVDSFGQVACGHNFPFQFNLFNNVSPDGTKHPVPLQGDTDGSRKGDEIYSKGIRLRVQIENDAAKHNNTWKFWLVEYNTVQGTPCIPSDFFHVVTGNNLMETVQQDRWKAQLLGTYRTQARDVGADKKTNIYMNKWIPLKRKLCFKDDSSLVITKGMKEVMSVVGVCYDSSNTLGNTGVGNYRAHATFYYGDP
jgi:hypothetical protein